MPNCCCARDDLPWAGRGTDLDISGCRFSLYPMCSDFVPLILGALEKTDTTKVWKETDALSTVYRGRLGHVFDAVGGLFANAYTPDVHMALEAQVSKGCPGDISGDSMLEVGDALPNAVARQGADFPVLCKLALYPLGCGDYIDHIAHVWRLAEAKGLKPATIHYATRIGGAAKDVLGYLEEVCAYMQDKADHYVLTFTLSVNSPTAEEA